MLKIIKAIWFYLKVYRHTIRVILDYVCKPLRGHKTAIVYLLILFYGWQLVRHGIVIDKKLFRINFDIYFLTMSISSILLTFRDTIDKLINKVIRGING